MKRITSRQNPIVARYRAARRGEAADMLLDGVHLVSDAIAAGVALHDVVVAGDALDRPDLHDLLQRLARAGFDPVIASALVMAALSPVRSSSTIVALAARPAVDASRLYAGTATLVVGAIDVQDPGNVGAIVRVAEAAGASGVVTGGGSASPFSWKALRGSMGSALRLPVVAGADPAATVADARRHGCRVIATTPRAGRSLFDVDYTGPVAILVGGEGAGLPADLIDAADARVTVPMEAPVESLNAAITAGLIVYEAKRQRERRGRR
jgi:TrmH family RNA methyltransferase